MSGLDEFKKAVFSEIKQYLFIYECETETRGITKKGLRKILDGAINKAFNKFMGNDERADSIEMSDKSPLFEEVTEMLIRAADAVDLEVCRTVIMHAQFTDEERQVLKEIYREKLAEIHG